MKINGYEGEVIKADPDWEWVKKGKRKPVIGWFIREDGAIFPIDPIGGIVEKVCGSKDKIYLRTPDGIEYEHCWEWGGYIHKWHEEKEEEYAHG